jgi:glycine cleavage system aminomethyltransferase T/glycine/D-amino acid oxidase-like deaminating enzyme
MRAQARLVIVGAGIVGVSAAYHLAERGWRDIVVLDRGPLFETGGSTSHAPGLVFQTNPSRTMTQLARRTVALYRRLGENGDPCFHPVGSMEVATTPARLAELRRRRGFGRSWGLEGAVLTPGEARARLPLLDAAKILGAYFVPDDGIAKAVRACEWMARAIEPRGVAFHGETPVTGIDVRAGRVRGVETPGGRVDAEQVLICAGIWGPRAGRLAGITIPLLPMQHLYARTAPLPPLAGETREAVHPILRHQDRSMYFRQHADAYGVGSYRHEPLPVDPDAVPSPAIMPFTPEHFETALSAAAELLPALRGADLPYRINGLFSFTADGFPLIGEAAEVRGLWVAEAVWITHAGGVGQAVAEWMADGDPGLDLHECDLNRFPAHALTPAYVRVRGAQQYREVYDIVHPLQQMEQPRGLRVGPFHRRQTELGAVFFETAGWERPQWFTANERLLEAAGAARRGPERGGWEAREWSPIQAGEHWAARNAAVLFDLTPFTKIEVAGPGALAFLQHLCANQIDQPEGRVVYTAMLSHRGGIVSDLTVTRLGPDRFLVLTGGAVGPRDLTWIRGHLRPDDDSVRVAEVTSAYCGVGLWGPRARAVLGAVCAEPLSNEAFPYFAARPLTVGSIPALALRVSYVGELGWEIYARTEYGLGLWDALWQAGRPHGLAALGAGAFDSLRLEKGYRLWGADLTPEHHPYEAGLGFAVRLGKGGFLGREALARIKAEEPSRKLCCLTLAGPGSVVLGTEPVLDGDRVLGYVTSANYGYTAGCGIAYAYLPLSHAAHGTPVDIEYFGERRRAVVSEEPLYDPKGVRLRA